MTPFKYGEVVEHVDGGHLRVDAELLRQIAEHLAHFVLLLEDVDAVERDGAGIGVLQGGDGAHEGALAGAVRAEQSEHVIADGEGDVLEGANAVGISLGEIGDGECHEGCSRVACDSTMGGQEAVTLLLRALVSNTAASG